VSEFTVPTAQLRLALWLTDGRTLEGDVFLPARSPLRDGPMLAGEWANVAPAFVPLRPAIGSEVMLVNRSHIVAMALPAGVPAVDPVEWLDVPVQRVIIETTCGRRVEGRLAVNMPRHRQRVVDWVNGADAYLTLDVDGRAHLVQKAHITRIVQLGEE
jgi:hypothetical protein